MTLPTLQTERKKSTKTQQRIKKIASFVLLTKILADFKSVIYLLTLVA
jgi:hypothetical protein